MDIKPKINHSDSRSSSSSKIPDSNVYCNQLRQLFGRLQILADASTEKKVVDVFENEVLELGNFHNDYGNGIPTGMDSMRFIAKNNRPPTTAAVVRKKWWVKGGKVGKQQVLLLSEKKSLLCNICYQSVKSNKYNFAYTVRYHVLSHVHKQKGIAAWQCKLCGIQIVSYYNLKKHIKTVHRDVAVGEETEAISSNWNNIETSYYDTFELAFPSVPSAYRKPTLDFKR